MDRPPNTDRPPCEDRIEAAAQEFRSADAAAALTGAGVSVPSGIPPFRGEGGIWSAYDPDAFDVWRFRQDPGDFWADWLDLRADLLDADTAPNPAHHALADMTTQGLLDAVVTQNIDGLHQAAVADSGAAPASADVEAAPASADVETTPASADDDSASEVELHDTGDVVELHGNARRAVCQNCGRTTSADEARARAEEGELPPRCDTCDGALKPDAVLFGEQLDPEVLARARRLATESDVLLVAGSSLTVEPAASLPARAADRGATLILVNLDETPLDSRADYVFRRDVTEALPALRDAAGK